ncbi:cadherin repeat domain-containing protein [Sessilibacter corallicola]|uniref:cadherin repeat domain-containing protein n=1 Tax=Sessilibacter corallicola TaxID=2904075 RepID=UPI001E6439AD|nr:cadherin repeat domain-containing protein [Sessilibacter corallicola]MCE2030328.1 cadherin repeat domain-containing protein [Sessilibacter corallicola]
MALTTTLVACGGGGGGGGSNPPEFTSDASVTVLENRTATGYVATAVSSDEGGVTFSIVGGEDANSFSVDGATGELAFITPQNFEAPNDGNGNNTYLLTLQATDAEGNTSTLDLTVNVINEFNLGITQTFPSVNANYGGVNEVVVTGLISDSESENNIIPMDAVESLTVNGVEIELDPQNPGAWTASIPADQTLRSLDISLTDANGNITEASQAVINIPVFRQVTQTVYDEDSQQIYFIATVDDVDSDQGFVFALGRFDIAAATYEILSELDEGSDFAIENAANLIFDSMNQRLIYRDNSVFPDIIRFVEVDLLTGNRTLFADVVNDDDTDTRVNNFVYDEINNRGFLTKGISGQLELYSIDFNLNSLAGVINPDTNEIISNIDQFTLNSNVDRIYFLSSPGDFYNLNILDLSENTLQTFSESTVRSRSAGRGRLFIDEDRNRLILDPFGDYALIDKLTGEVESLLTSRVGNGFIQSGTLGYGPISNTSVAATRDGRFAQIAIDQEVTDSSLENEGVITPFLPRSGDGRLLGSTGTFFLSENNELLRVNTLGIFAVNLQNGDRSEVTADFPDISNASAIDSVVFDQNDNRVFGFTVGLPFGDFAGRFSVYELDSDTTTVLSEVPLSEAEDVSGNSPITIGNSNRGSLLHDVDRNRIITAVTRFDTTIRYFSVDTDTGERTPLFNDFDPEASPLFGDNILRVFDQSSDVILVSNGERDSLYRFNLTTQELALVSSDTLGDGPAGVFTNQSAITTDFDNNRVLIASDNTIHAVDLTTGNRSVLIASDESGPVFLNPGAIELSEDSERLYVSSRTRGLILSIHLASGQKTILSD